MLKGSQGWAGRALVGLEALELCKELLRGYKVVLYSVEPGREVEKQAKVFVKKTGVEVEIIPLFSPHEAILKMHGSARLSISLNVTDGVSISFLEALVMGSFPIQSNTSCADEWVENGKTAFIVSPDKPKNIAKMIRRALLDDKLVDNAAENNWQIAQKKLDYNDIKRKAINFYLDEKDI
jgi:glycosyltransferase involved in cell wall biosynthesis